MDIREDTIAIAYSRGHHRPEMRSRDRSGSLQEYEVGDFFDEMFAEGGRPRSSCAELYSHVQDLTADELTRRQQAASRSMVQLGITFNVYGDQEGTPYEDIQWRALLRSASALEMYRQRHGQISPVDVVDFLVLDREFPRAVLHCLIKANDSLHAITGSPLGSFRNLPEQRLGQLHSELAFRRADEIVATGLHEFIDNLQLRLNLVGDAVFQAFFTVRPMPSMQLQTQ